MTPPNQASHYPSPNPASAPHPQSRRSIAALICGILSLTGYTFLTGIPAIILGRMELKAIDQGLSAESNRNMAKIGYILGILGTVIPCLFGIFLALFFLVIALVAGTAAHQHLTF